MSVYGEPGDRATVLAGNASRASLLPAGRFQPVGPRTSAQATAARSRAAGRRERAARRWRATRFTILRRYLRRLPPGQRRSRVSMSGRSKNVAIATADL